MTKNKLIKAREWMDNMDRSPIIHNGGTRDILRTTIKALDAQIKACDHIVPDVLTIKGALDSLYVNTDYNGNSIDYKKVLDAISLPKIEGLGELLKREYYEIINGDIDIVFQAARAYHKLTGGDDGCL